MNIQQFISQLNTNNTETIHESNIDFILSFKLFNRGH